ncbi:hypothetical protein [uncultured Sphaerotilus sp.]|uniref:hypothetical protein n=1 Tax=uncultured Sphaerotilus sp. TaxID=474984 RepID=UPI0030CA2195
MKIIAKNFREILLGCGIGVQLWAVLTCPWPPGVGKVQTKVRGGLDLGKNDGGRSGLHGERGRHRIHQKINQLQKIALDVGSGEKAVLFQAFQQACGTAVFRRESAAIPAREHGIRL